MKEFITILMILMIIPAGAELVNLNPDPDGEPWIAGGLTEPTPEQLERMNEIPELIVPEKYLKNGQKLPYSIDNSVLPYFRPVFNQRNGSCGTASGVGYLFTYEINMERDADADSTFNQYPTHHTYNFLNGGDGGNGSWYWDAWDIIDANGCPDVDVYGGMWPDNETYIAQLWTDGYEKYESGMNNRVTDIYSIDVSDTTGLNTLKQWFNDHGDGSAYGGLVNFAAGSDGLTAKSLPSGTEHGGEYVVTAWASAMDHAMTLVGYNDSVRYDYNNDGRYTNDLDINGDSVVDMKDWEIGAVRMVNSWSDTWADSGKAWVMYRTLAQDISDGGIWNNIVHTCRTRESFEPSLKIKAVIEHGQRDQLKIFAGVSTDTSLTEPEHTISFPLFSYQGGAYGLRGDIDTLEIGLDITPLLTYVSSGEDAKYFLCIDEFDPSGTASGSVISFSVIDGDSIETVSSYTDVRINDDTETYVPLIRSTSFDPPLITNSSLPNAQTNEFYSETLSASGGTSPYFWSTVVDYNETAAPDSFPVQTANLLSTNSDDDGYGIIDLDFGFPFYGTVYDSITVSTDGSILFSGGFEGVRSENAILAAKTISPYAADLMSYPADGDGIYYKMTTEYLEVRWITSKWGQPEIDLDFSAKIYKTGNIEFYYNSGMTTGLNWASGISEGDITTGLISELSNTNDPSGMETAFSTAEYPYGMDISQDGVFSGTVNESSTWNIIFKVTDDNDLASFKTFSFSSELGVPANLSVIPGASAVDLSWDPVSSAQSYDIYRSDDPYSGFSKIGNTSDTSYEDTSASGSMNFYYIVTVGNK